MLVEEVAEAPRPQGTGSSLPTRALKGTGGDPHPLTMWPHMNLLYTLSVV